MSFEITTSFVSQFRSNLAMLAQQKRSRLIDRVTVEPAVGATLYYDQIGASQAQQRTTRHTDTMVANTPHRRRRIDLKVFDWADLIENADKARLLADPTSSYVAAGNAAINRAIDQEIINNFFATANTGDGGTTPVTFPASQQVAVNSWTYGAGTGNAGLTVSKLIEARMILFGQEAVDDLDEQDMPNTYIGVTAKQIGNMLSTTEATSKDYAEVQALVQGKISQFMGFQFVRLPNLPLDGSGYFRVPVWQKEGVVLAVDDAATDVSIDIRADKNRAIQPFYSKLFGAARVEEARVVEIKCL